MTRRSTTLIRSFVPAICLAAGVATAEDRAVCQLVVDERLTATFAECSGIGSENEIIEHKIVTSDGREIVRKIPGRLRYSNIVLKRGLTSGVDIWTWRREVELNGVADARHNGMLTILDKSGAVVASWTFENAWPAMLTATESDDVESAGVEEVTLAVEDIIRIE